MGLWLLLRPKPKGTAAKIELFGMKFESSSAGVLVFLIGAVFLALPILVPMERAGTTPNTTTVGVGAPEARSGTEGAGDAASAAGVTLPEIGSGERRALLLPEEGAEEGEPNNTVHEANQVTFGSTAREVGDDRDDLDWFVIPVSGPGPVVTVGLRLIEGSDVEASVYDQHEQRIGGLESRSGVGYLEVELGDTDRLYVRIDAHSGSTASYEVFTRAGEAPGDD